MNHESPTATTHESTTMDVKIPVFPTEIFGRIIDILCEKPSSIALTPEEWCNANNFSLVCSSFLPLARRHIFRCIRLKWCRSLEYQFENLALLLESSSGIQTWIRFLGIDLGYYFGKHISPVLTRALSACLSIPHLESHDILYSSSDRECLTSEMGIGLLCHQLIANYLSKDILRVLVAKQFAGLTISPSLSSSLHTLDLKRCDLNLTEAIHSVKYLTIRKMEVSFTFLSYFPNLEKLRIIRAHFVQGENVTTPLRPPAHITHLGLELCNGMGEHGDEIAKSISQFLDLFHLESTKRGINPFNALQTLDIVVPHDFDFSALAVLFQNITRLDSLCLHLPPLPQVAFANLADTLKSLRPSECLTSCAIFQDFDKLELADLSPPLSTPGLIRYALEPQGAAIDFDPFAYPSESASIQDSLEALGGWNQFFKFLGARNHHFEKVNEMEIRLLHAAKEQEITEVKQVGIEAAAWKGMMALVKEQKCGAQLLEKDRRDAYFRSGLESGSYATRNAAKPRFDGKRTDAPALAAGSKHVNL
ncbi:hypothetical protein CVT24_008481 [Panaeolus cyanescens]|uniref:Uncharacterized protein n=1 Tax=Panaeolus cyanescens TaxID=181874 RepID=A0A409VBS8_9AGAR|nr:hypothetical protein CVT24_008481 [Panaeolus cyanescens]